MDPQRWDMNEGDKQCLMVSGEIARTESGGGIGSRGPAITSESQFVRESAECTILTGSFLESMPFRVRQAFTAYKKAIDLKLGNLRWRVATLEMGLQTPIAAATRATRATPTIGPTSEVEVGVFHCSGLGRRAQFGRGFGDSNVSSKSPLEGSTASVPQKKSNDPLPGPHSHQEFGGFRQEFTAYRQAIEEETGAILERVIMLEARISELLHPPANPVLPSMEPDEELRPFRPGKFPNHLDRGQ